jgi:PKD repeat protein
MKTRKLKNTLFLLIAMLMVLARSTSAQGLIVMGNVSDANNMPVVNHLVTITANTNSGIPLPPATTYTDSLGDYNATLTINSTLNQGVVVVSIADCNGTMLTNTHYWSPNTPTIVSNFVSCGFQNPCTLSGVSVHYDSLTNHLVASVSGGTLPYTFSWSNGNTILMVPYYQGWCVTVTDMNGCDTTICDTTSVAPCPLYGAYVTANANGLQASTMTMPPYALVYLWSNGTTGSWSAFYQNWCVQIIDSITGCDTTICQTNTNPPCQAAFIAHPDSANPNNIYFYDLSTPIGTINSWLWDFGDNSTSTLQNPQHSYNASGSYYVCLTITSQISSTGAMCTSTFCDSVWVGSGGMPCYASFQSTQVNASDSTHFFNTSFGITASTTYFWDFGDGSTSTDENPIHLYASSGYYTVCLTITDTITNCHDTECHTIFVSIGATQPCTLMGVSVMLDSTTMLMEATWDSNYAYQWTNGLNTQHTQYYPYWCVHIIDVTTGCDTVICDTNITNPPCQAHFFSSPAWMPNTYEFYDYSIGFPTNWLWDFGDGTTSTLQNPTHTYQNTASGFYLVCLTIYEYDPVTQALICSDTYCDSIYIQNQSSCSASFYSQDLGNNTIQIINTSNPNTPMPFPTVGVWNWDMGDGTTYTMGSPTHTYSSPGTYYVCVEYLFINIATGDTCISNFCDSVTVTSGPIPCHADFTYYRDSIVINNPNGTTFVGLGNIFYFIDLSMPIGIISTWSWDMGDFGAGTYHQGTSSSSQFPVYEYDTSGTYYACLTITILIGGNTCSSTYCDTIIAYPSPPPTGIIAQNFIKEVIIYPNPANDKLAIDMQITESGTIQINFINMMGQKLSQQKVSAFGGQLKLITDVSHLPNGVYTIEFVVNNSKLHKRVIITR